ncbi:MAG: putative toxin-antitoxin system toxin component, PIN family [Steroidobacteraceae bacterium]
MPRRLVIVCFDTNVLVSAVATRGICADIVNAALAEHRLVVGATALSELRQVLLAKPRLPASTANEMDAFLRLHATVIPKAAALEFRELKQNDRAVLAEAIAGQPDVLVTGDQDLLRVAARAPIKILPPRGFWKLLRGG